jgi:hypothetical protein
MNRSRKVTLSLALFVLLCFFLPWVELSCMGVQDSVSGYDLARAGDRSLWFVPGCMLAIILSSLSRSIGEKMPAIFAMAGALGGGISAYLMYHARSSTNDSPRLIATHWTVLFWFGFAACVGLVAAALRSYFKQARSP